MESFATRKKEFKNDIEESIQILNRSLDNGLIDLLQTLYYLVYTDYDERQQDEKDFIKSLMDNKSYKEFCEYFNKKYHGCDTIFLCYQYRNKQKKLIESIEVLIDLYIKTKRQKYYLEKLIIICETPFETINSESNVYINGYNEFIMRICEIVKYDNSNFFDFAYDFSKKHAGK